MSVLTGVNGHISKGNVGGGGEVAIPCIRTWAISLSTELSELTCSASGGAKMRLAGNTDWSGSFTGYGHTPPVWPGDKFEIECAITGAVGLSGDAVCEGVEINIDGEGGGAIGYSVSFGADGVLAKGAITCPADLSVPSPLPAAGRIVKIATAPTYGTFADVAEVRSAVLSFSQASAVYSSSGLTAHKRRAVGNLDGSLALTVYAAAADGWASAPQPGTNYAVRVYVTDTVYWDIRWMMCRELGGMDVDIEGGSMVGGSLSFDFNGFSDVSGTPTKGFVLDPSTAAKW